MEFNNISLCKFATSKSIWHNEISVAVNAWLEITFSVSISTNVANEISYSLSTAQHVKCMADLKGKKNALLLNW